MRPAPGIRPSRSQTLAVALAGLTGMAAGSFLTGASRTSPARADDRPAAHGKAAAGVKAPIEEVLHCPLAFAGVHLLKEMPEHSQVAYHYCKPLNADVNQCVLYDGNGPDARLIGIEYLVTDALYQKMPAEEKNYWHDHKYEVDTGLLKSLTQAGNEEKATLGVVRTLWGKAYHTWSTGKTYPVGPPRLYWSVTGEEPFVFPTGAKLPTELEGRRPKPAAR